MYFSMEGAQGEGGETGFDKGTETRTEEPWLPWRRLACSGGGDKSLKGWGWRWGWEQRDQIHFSESSLWLHAEHGLTRQKIEVQVTEDRRHGRGVGIKWMDSRALWERKGKDLDWCPLCQQDLPDSPCPQDIRPPSAMLPRTPCMLLLSFLLHPALATGGESGIGGWLHVSTFQSYWHLGGSLFLKELVFSIFVFSCFW